MTLRGATGRIGIGTTSPVSLLTVAGGITTLSRADSTPNGTASNVFDDLVIGSTGTVNTGMTIFGTGQTGISFGDAAGAIQGQIRYQHSNDEFEWFTNNTERMNLSSAGLIVSTAANNDGKVQLSSTATTYYLRGGATLGYTRLDGPSVRLYAGGSKILDATTSGVDVTGAFSATTKSFLIDHPTKPGKKLRHGSLEGPENGVYIRGKGKTAIIELPEYWTELIDEDSITVQLTPIGKHQHIYVESIKNNVIHIQSDEARKNTNNLEYYYLILAERKDVDKLVIEE